jgi:hypothetical protein
VSLIVGPPLPGETIHIAVEQVKYGALLLLGETVQQEKQTASLPDGHWYGCGFCRLC